MFELPDHPDIRRAMATGYAHKRITHYCPKCGAEMSADTTLYLNDDGEIIACDQCVEKTTVDEYYDA